MSRFKSLAALAGLALVAGLAFASPASAAQLTTTKLTVSAEAVALGSATGTITFSSKTSAKDDSTKTPAGTSQYWVNDVLQSGVQTKKSVACGKYDIKVKFTPDDTTIYGGSSDLKTVTVDVVGGTCGTDSKPVRPIRHKPAPVAPVAAAPAPAPAQTVTKVVTVVKTEQPVAVTGSPSFTG